MPKIRTLEIQNLDLYIIPQVLFIYSRMEYEVFSCL